MKLMRDFSVFAYLCQRIAMDSHILVLLTHKGKLKFQDFIHRNDFQDSALRPPIKPMLVIISFISILLNFTDNVRWLTDFYGKLSRLLFAF